jgi:lipid II:glycine glycyltransferase (peptidoglycan interpeptide bridge formation enzyme)
MALTSGIVFCQVDSWLTGRRLVSLPFSDHCEPLGNSVDGLEALLGSLTRELHNSKWKYIEIRPRVGFQADSTGFGQGEVFYFHSLDLRPSAEDLFRNFHKSCIQRKIQRASQNGLTYEEGASKALLKAFYHLLLLTRRRHELPPQPLAWFRNLIICMGEKARIRVCFKGNQPIAAMITLAYKDSVVYKYGCSDAQFHNLGGVPFLFWKAIQDAKQSGTIELDLGRSDCDNEGLSTFKQHLGGNRSLMTYWTFPAITSPGSVAGVKPRVPKRLFRWIPDKLLVGTGRILYKHMG